MPLSVDPKQVAEFAAIASLIRRHRKDIESAVPGIVAVRPGYKFDEATGKTSKAIVVLVDPGKHAAAVRAAETLAKRLKTDLEVLPATPEDVVESARLRGGMEEGAGGPPSEFERFLFRAQPAGIEEGVAPRRGDYQKPKGLSLREIVSPVKVTICASPDAGWSTLHEFIGSGFDKLSVAMYQFTAPHIYEALRTAIQDKQLNLALHPRPEKIQKTGVKSGDTAEPEIVEGLQEELGDKMNFAWTSVGKNGTFASAYHIKVAVADEKRLWLSSGNWQSSNQPAEDGIDAHGGLAYQRRYNRDYHVVVSAPELAGVFNDFIEYDIATAKKKAAPGEELPEPELPVLLLPLDISEARAEAKYFEPKKIERKLRIQPLLTPDNYAELTLDFIRGAKRRLLFQNQYINLNSESNFPEFEELVQALLEKQREISDVRIICRDMMRSDKLDMLVSLGFDRSKIRFQPACHNKTIIRDSEAVLFGSHNWSNEGAVTNRDASLIFFDPEIAKYYEQIWVYDWDRLATAKPMAVRMPRVAGDEESPDPRSEVVPWTDFYSD